jgi:ubiquinone/menaquinone biosynthesis C-methylase UbiE
MFHPDGPTFFELMRQALQSTEEGYDLLAPKFDRTPFRTPDGIIDAIAKDIGPQRSIDAALDVCCGTGAAMRLLRPLCRERIVGVDFSVGMIEEAKRRLADTAECARSLAALGHAPDPGDARIELVRSDVFEMPFDREFDVAVCVGALGHILPKDEERFCERVRKTLKPKGRFYVATAELPPITSRGLWMARAFNAVMRVRNAMLRPEFIMYYLTFLWPDVKWKLERAGFTVEAKRDVFPMPFDRGILVVATRRDY